MDVINGKQAAKKELFCWESCRAHTALIEGLRARFAPDVVALRAHGLHDFNSSFDTMRDECAERDRVCNSLHDTGPWSRARELGLKLYRIL